jgi:long-subunit acyl-CoA synthetase (AMP-forming)
MKLSVDSVALDDGQRIVTARELPTLLASEWSWLASLSKHDARFALLAENGAGWAITDLALHAARAVNVPLPAYFTDRRIAHALDDASIDVIISDDPQRIERLGHRFRLWSISPSSGLLAFVRAWSPAERTPLPPGTTKITDTSGSTGTPKGVCLSAEAMEQVAASLAAATHAFGAARHLCLQPLGTLLDNLAGLLAARLNGAACLLPPSRVISVNYGAVDRDALLRWLTRQRPESVILVPELLQLLVGAIERWLASAGFAEVHRARGAAVAPDLLRQAEALGLPVFEGYGLSECTSVVSLNTPEAHRIGSVGKPLPHAHVRIDEAGRITCARRCLARVSGRTYRSACGPRDRHRRSR